jgi:hypothetical protein
MKRNFLIGLVLMGVLASGCSARNSMSNVKRTFPNAEIQPCPEQPFAWLVLESNKVYWVMDNGAVAGEVDREGLNCIEIFGNVCK